MATAADAAPTEQAPAAKCDSDCAQISPADLAREVARAAQAVTRLTEALAQVVPALYKQEPCAADAPAAQDAATLLPGPAAERRSVACQCPCAPPERLVRCPYLRHRCPVRRECCAHVVNECGCCGQLGECCTRRCTSAHEEAASEHSAGPDEPKGDAATEPVSAGGQVLMLFLFVMLLMWLLQ